MRMLELDADDVKNLSEITEREALEFLELGEQIVCRTNSRDFQELSKVDELQRLSKLKEEGIYNHLEFYVKWH